MADVVLPPPMQTLPDKDKAFNPLYSLFGSLFGSTLGGLFGSGGDWSNPADAAMPYLNKIQGTIQPLYQPYMDTGLKSMDQYYNNASSWATPEGAQKNYNTIAGGYQESPYAQYQNQNMQQKEAQTAAASGTAGTPAQQLAVANQTNQINSKDMNNYINSILGIQQQGQSGLGDLTHLGASETNNYIQDLFKTLMAQASVSYAGQANQNKYNSAQGDFWSSLGGLAGSTAGFIPFL
jgi:hypothetical protein